MKFTDGPLVRVPDGVTSTTWLTRITGGCWERCQVHPVRRLRGAAMALLADETGLNLEVQVIAKKETPAKKNCQKKVAGATSTPSRPGKPRPDARCAGRPAAAAAWGEPPARAGGARRPPLSLRTGPRALPSGTRGEGRGETVTGRTVREGENGGDCGPPREGGAEFTASGVPRETCWPGDPAFPQIVAPARPARPLISPPQTHPLKAARKVSLGEAEGAASARTRPPAATPVPAIPPGG